MRVRTDGTVAGCFAGLELLVVEGGVASRLTPDALIVTTGSTDLPFPFAGATLPGVFSARGMQILLNRAWVRPGRRFAIVGGDADAEELAVDILLAGGEVVWSGIAPAPFLRAEGAKACARWSLDRILRGRRHRDRRGPTGRPRACDDGRRAARFLRGVGGLVPLFDDRMRSPVCWLFVAGDAAGVGSVAAVIAEGRLAGISAAASLGLASEEDVAAVRENGGPELAWRLGDERRWRPSRYSRTSELSHHARH